MPHRERDDPTGRHDCLFGQCARSVIVVIWLAESSRVAPSPSIVGWPMAHWMAGAGLTIPGRLSEILSEIVVGSVCDDGLSVNQPEFLLPLLDWQTGRPVQDDTAGSQQQPVPVCVSCHGRTPVALMIYLPLLECTAETRQVG